MINKVKRQAEDKLQKHRELGNRSNLSIIEVANLMDIITFGPTENSIEGLPIFFSYQMN